MEIIKFKKKKMKLLTKRQQESNENSRIIDICKVKDIVKLVIIFIMQGDVEVLLIAYVI